MLAVLAHARGEPVTADALMDRVWDGSPPRTAPDTLQTYLSRLRRRLRACGDTVWLERSGPGSYRLRVPPASLDLLRFDLLRGDARAAVANERHEQAVALLRTAEGLWHGEPLAEFPGTWAASTRGRLVEDLRRIREERIRLELDGGRQADLIGELRELVAQHPFAQQLVASLMLALYRCGRHDEALDAYQAARRRLRDRQGLEPTAELRELHARILDQDAELLHPATPTAPATHTAPVAPQPCSNLPRVTPDFTGRADELAALLTHPGPDPHGARALPVTVLHGMPGVGKTSLAVLAAHRLSGAYPDGQLFLDLRGYSGRQPYDPAEALAVLLQACGALPGTLDTPGKPLATLDQRMGKWREWTSRRRLLLVLDNARDTAQVEPLLPGSSHCRVIVTSRDRLRLDGAGSLHLDVLSTAEATALFTRVVGHARVAGDTGALADVVNACGRHPLALQLLADRFRHRESWDLGHLLDRLRQDAAHLDDAIASVFRLSYTGLSDAAQRTFRYLALHPGADLTFPAAAALTRAGGAEPSRADGPALTCADDEAPRLRRAIDELEDRNLLDEPVPDRYRLHDLARAFALQICDRTEPQPVRHAALERLAAYYLTTAHRAGGLAHRHHRLLPLAPEYVSPCASEFPDEDSASVWLSVERANLLAVADRAAAEGLACAAWFPHVLAASLKRWGARKAAADLYAAAVPALRDRGADLVLARTLVERADLLAQDSPEEALRTAQAALAIFRRHRDTLGCADALLQAGRAHVTAGDSEATLRVLTAAKRHYRRGGDRHGEAECLNVRGLALVYAGRYREALASVRATLSLRRDVGDLHGSAMALNNLGELQRHEGDFDAARASYEQSLTLMQRCGDRQDLAILATNLGTVHLETGRLSQALTYFHRALHSHRAAGDALGEANVLICLGTAYARSGREGEALRHFTMAERVAAGIGNTYEHQRALLGAADLHRESGRVAAAREGYERALSIARDTDLPLGAAHALAGLTRLSLSSNRLDLAHTYAERAAQLYRQAESEGEAERLEHLLRERAGS